MTESYRIGMIGARGVPATYGGVEHHIEELGSRLAGRGHEVVVFSRTNYTSEQLDEYKGMRLVHLPTVSSKHFEALVHSARSTIAAMRLGLDIIHYHAVGPGIVAVLPRLLRRSSVVQTIHGRDADRPKWGTAARSLLRVAAWLSARVPDETVVVSRALESHYLSTYGSRTTYIPNGMPIRERAEPDIINAKYGLRGNDFVLFVGRLVPSKCPHVLIEAFRRTALDMRLVIAGGSSYTDAYVSRLHELASEDSRIVMTGYVYGRELDELYTNAALFVQPSALEGLPLTLLEAMGAATPVVASNIPPHVEVLQTSSPGGRIVPVEDVTALKEAMEDVAADLVGESAGARVLRDRAARHYDWDLAADMLEDLYGRMRTAT